jgi:hypothetical protein
MEECKQTPPLFRLSDHQAAGCYLFKQNPTIEPGQLSELLPV